METVKRACTGFLQDRWLFPAASPPLLAFVPPGTARPLSEAGRRVCSQPAVLLLCLRACPPAGPGARGAVAGEPVGLQGVPPCQHPLPPPLFPGQACPLLESLPGPRGPEREEECGRLSSARLSRSALLPALRWAPAIGMVTWPPPWADPRSLLGREGAPHPWVGIP